MSLPFHIVTTRTGKKTHLALNTPAIAGHAPGRLPSQTLCSSAVTGASPAHIADVECLTCLFAAPQFMAMPSFGVRT